jgi:FAD-dependent urate hydroxylase
VIGPSSVAIVGYGIGGVAAAIRLRRQGHQITHFERNNSVSVLGAGMLLHPPALRQLHTLNLLEAAASCGALVRSVGAQTISGEQLMDINYTDLLAGQCGLGIQRRALHRLLSSADAGREAVVSGCSIESADTQRGYLFEGPTKAHGPFDLIVIADGTHSVLRDQIANSARRNDFAKSAALVGLLHDPQGVAGERLVQYFDSNRHVSVWPVGSASPVDPQYCSFAMNVPLVDAPAFRDQGRWRTELLRLCPNVGQLLNDTVNNSDLHIFSYRDVELSRYAAGCAVLIGDAAHSMSPQLGVGAQLAMEDADVLAHCLAEHQNVPTALRTYSKTRPLQLQRYQQASRWITPLFQSDSRLLAAVRNRLISSMAHTPLLKSIAKELLT